MTHAFVPLLNSLRLATPPAAGAAPAFQAVQPSSPPNPANAGPDSAPPVPLHAHQPVLNLKRDGDRITEIEIRCGCGQVIRLECDYAPMPG